jgi:hypothetical protein
MIEDDPFDEIVPISIMSLKAAIRTVHFMVDVSPKHTQAVYAYPTGNCG